MLYKKILGLILITALSAFLFVACDETTATEDPVPKPISNLMATSIDSATVALKFDASPSEIEALFKEYVVEITPGTFSPIIIPKGTTIANITGLPEIKEYTFSIKAVFSNGKASVPVSVKWAPAHRYNFSIRVYEYASSRGSGLVFQDDDGQPRTLTAASNVKWDICLDTRNNIYQIGSPKASDYTDDKGNYNNNNQPARNLDIYKVVENVDKLSDVFDSQGIDKNPNPLQKMIDFTTKTKGFVLFVKSYPPGNPAGNFAKVFVTAKNGVILQGTAPDRYVELEVSYQKTPGLPYAITNKNNNPAPVIRKNLNAEIR